ncbi:MAG: hypothetical protein GY849_09045 [Deltaproteobacteria bacterium]|nr:hypothetical protein [Deltaproteobacteria bacterium]
MNEQLAIKTAFHAVLKSLDKYHVARMAILEKGSNKKTKALINKSNGTVRRAVSNVVKLMKKSGISSSRLKKFVGDMLRLHEKAARIEYKKNRSAAFNYKALPKNPELRAKAKRKFKTLADIAKRKSKEYLKIRQAARDIEESRIHAEGKKLNEHLERLEAMLENNPDLSRWIALRNAYQIKLQIDNAGIRSALELMHKEAVDLLSLEQKTLDEIAREARDLLYQRKKSAKIKKAYVFAGEILQSDWKEIPVNIVTGKNTWEMIKPTIDAHLKTITKKGYKMVRTKSGPYKNDDRIHFANKGDLKNALMAPDTKAIYWIGHGDSKHPGTLYTASKPIQSIGAVDIRQWAEDALQRDIGAPEEWEELLRQHRRVYKKRLQKAHFNLEYAHFHVCWSLYNKDLAQALIGTRGEFHGFYMLALGTSIYSPSRWTKNKEKYINETLLPTFKENAIDIKKDMAARKFCSAPAEDIRVILENVNYNSKQTYSLINKTMREYEQAAIKKEQMASKLMKEAQEKFKSARVWTSRFARKVKVLKYTAEVLVYREHRQYIQGLCSLLEKNYSDARINRNLCHGMNTKKARCGNKVCSLDFFCHHHDIKWHWLQ